MSTTDLVAALFALILVFVFGVFDSRPRTLHALLLGSYVFVSPWNATFPVALSCLWSALLLARARRDGVASVLPWLLAGALVFLAPAIALRPGLSIRTWVLYPAATGLLYLWIILQTIRSFADLKSLLVTYATLRTFELAIYGLVQYVLGTPLLRTPITYVTSSYLGNVSAARLYGVSAYDPVVASGCLVFALGVWVYLASVEARTVYWLPAGLCLVALVLTWARTGWVAAVFTMLLFVLLRGGQSMRSGRLVGSVVLATAVLVPLADFVASRFESEARLGAEQTWTFRMMIWQAALGGWRRMTMFGPGVMDTFKEGANVSGISMSLENAILGAFAATGWVGGLGFTALYVGSLFSVWAGWFKLRTEEPMALAAAVVVTTQLAMMMTFHMRYDDPHVWLVFGIAGSAALLSRRATLASSGVAT